MSCQIRGIANIPDVDNVKKLLYGDAVSKCEFFVNIINIIFDLQYIHFFQLNIYRTMNYLFKIVLYRYRQLEMYLLWLGIQR